MVKKKKDVSLGVEPRSARITTEPKSAIDAHMFRVLLLGLLGEQSNNRGTVHVETLSATLTQFGVDNQDTASLVKNINELLRDHSWIGLEWTDNSYRELEIVPGIRWFSTSQMYRKLVDVRKRNESLADFFALKYESLIGQRAPELKLLVDAGTTTFRCLLHPNCLLTKNASEITTNNVFVSQWLSDKDNVKLVEGVWDVMTAGMVKCSKSATRLATHLSEKGRKPNVALLSWHYVKADPDNNNVWFCTHDEKETQMKYATFLATNNVVLMVVGKDKIGTAPPDAPKYSMRPTEKKNKLNLFNSQDPNVNNRVSSDRQVYLVTDLDDPTDEQKRVVEVFESDEVKKKRIWLVSPYKDTSPGV